MKELPFDPYDFFGYIACGIVVLVTGQTICGFPRLLGNNLTAFDTVTAILATYIAGQLVAGPASWMLETILVGRLLGAPTKILLGQRDGNFFRLLFPGYHVALPATVVKKLEEAIAPIKLTSPSEEIFLRIRYSSRVLSNDALMARLNTFRDKYGFNRNVAFSLISASIAFILSDRWFHRSVPGAYTATALGAGILLVYRYLKFYRQYSYELFNQFASGR